jgi:GDP-D-mannose dehydratase
MALAVDENRFRPIDRPVLCAEVGSAEEPLDWKSGVTFEVGIHEAIQSPLQDGRS